MSQCHDIYETAEAPGTAKQAQGASVPGAQCHDAYRDDEEGTSSEEGEPGDPADFGWPRPASTHSERGRLRERAHIVRVAGRVDWRTERTLRQIIQGDDRRDVIVNLTATAPGFPGRKDIIAFLARTRQQGRRVIVVSADPRSSKQLLGNGLGPIVRVASSEPEAVRWLARHPWPGMAS